MNIIRKYFKDLTELQTTAFDALFELYSGWNEKINVISRKDINNIYTHHILHSLSIAKFINFAKGTSVVDIGTGGGFPAIPLAIMFPDVHFHLVDSIGKKLIVASEVAKSINLNNCTFANIRMEKEKGMFDFAISRAAMSLKDLHKTTSKNISTRHKNQIANGLICLKGGDLGEEIKGFEEKVKIYEISDIFEEEFFSTKKIVYLPIST